MLCHTPRSSPAAWTRSSTSSAPIGGFSISSSRRTSSASPYFSGTIAFIVCLSRKARGAGLTLTAQAGATTAEVMRRAGHLSSRAALIYQHAAEQRDAVIAGLLSAVAAAHAGEPVDDTG